MSIFNDNDKAWSMFTRQVELRAGDPGAPTIVQSNAILRPLDCLSRYPKLNSFRKYRVGDIMPLYQRVTRNLYVNSESKVSQGYESYLMALNAALRAKYPGMNETEAEKRLKALGKAEDGLRGYLRDSREDWKKAHDKDPSLTFAVWDDEYGYSYKRKVAEDKRNEAYGAYVAVVAAYPVLYECAQALNAMLDSRTKVALPMDLDEVNEPEDSWSTFFKTYIDGDLERFATDVTPETLLVSETSQRSSSYDQRWSASASVNYGFFSLGASASGGTAEEHLRADSKNLSVSFKNLKQFSINRGSWYRGNLVNTHCKEVDHKAYWGPNGALNLVPLTVIMGRGVQVSIETSQRAYDSFRSWYSVSGGASFGFGPLQIGGGGSSSASRTEIRDDSSGTTLRLTDLSNQLYVVGVVSMKMDEMVSNDELRHRVIAEQEFLANVAQDKQWAARYALDRIDRADSERVNRDLIDYAIR